MTPKPNPTRPNPILIDDDAPEADDVWFSRARPAAEVLPGLLPAAAVAKALKPRGRPKVAATKKLVSLRLDADLLEHLRASGEEWQSRANAVLRKAAGL